MSSLQSIMNLDEDQQESSSPIDKKNKDHATPASGFRTQNPPASTSSLQFTHTDQTYSSTSLVPTIAAPVTEGGKFSHSTQYSANADPGSGSSVRQGKRPTAPILAAPALSSASSGSGHLRRQSSASVDSMDQYGYAFSSSLGGGSGGVLPPNHSRRPMGASPSPEVPVRYTPITGRVSRAKKGVPVHICESCNPPKTFTRAEHLRRHQLSHQQPRFPCDQCDRAFHRQDLLTRHQQRHNQEGGDQGSDGGNDMRRESGASGASGHGPHPPYSSAGHGFGGASTPSSMSDMPPGTPPTGSRSASMGMTSPRDARELASDQSNNYRYGVPGLSQVNSLESSPSPPAFSNVNYGMNDMIPRTAHLPLLVATQGLPESTLHASLDPPELIQSTDYSPWTSASESTYSTSGDQPSRQRQWRHAHQSSLEWQSNSDFLSAFPTNVRRSMATTEGLETVATTQYYDFPMSPQMAPTSQHLSHHSYAPLLSESIMPEFGSEQNQSLMDPTIGHHGVGHHRSLSVRSHTPELSIATSRDTADTLVTPAPLPHRIDSMAQARQKELLVHDGTQGAQRGVLDDNASWDCDSPGDSGILTGAGLNAGCGSNLAIVLTPLPRSVRNAVPAYIDIYWECFHGLYPVVHRQTFEEEGEDVLRCAMAAIATQYMSGKEDRIKGSQLHEFAWQEAKRVPQWNLQVMQAILLCELFARFRGRKAVVRPSKLFEHLYSRVLNHSPNLYESATPSHAASLAQQQPTRDMSVTKEERWRTWIETEGRRRLLAACFIVDNSASILHQQPYARDGIDPSTIPLTGPSDALWLAYSADEWFAILQSNQTASHANFLPRLNRLSPEEVAQYKVFDRSAILFAASLSLPHRHFRRASAGKGDEQEPASTDDLSTPTNASYASRTMKACKPEDRLLHLFSLCREPAAHVNVALHYTPLHDLLSVSGESWIFSQKVLVAPTFHDHQKRLRAWVEGRSTSPISPTTAGLEAVSGTKAIFHAAHALLAFFDGGDAVKSNSNSGIADYWALYVCALIVWAFGHSKTGKAACGGAGGSPTAAQTQPMSEGEAVAWLRAVAESGSPETIGRARGRREASAAVVSMVKRRLEADCVGGRSRLYVDAVGVLKKLEDGVDWRWF